MKKLLPLSAGTLVVAALPIAALAAFTKGGTAYTKRVETALLTEPSALSTPVARVSYAKSLKIEDLKGPWLKVSAESKSGWVFGGNVSETMPEDVKGLDGLNIEASKTTATAAARPLTPVEADYASRRGLTSATDDINWLHENAAAITTEKVDTFLQEQKKGEFQ